MIKHVLKNGQTVKSVAGRTITRNQAPNTYRLAQRINEGGEKNRSQKAGAKKP